MWMWIFRARWKWRWASESKRWYQAWVGAARQQGTRGLALRVLVADARNHRYPVIRSGVKGEFTQELTSR